MVLGEGLIDADGARHEMAGLLDVVTSMAARRRTLGYRVLRHASPLPWPQTLRGHEFHYSVEIDPAGDPVARLGRGGGGGASPLFEAADATGAPLGAIGRIRGRVIGSYAHVIDAAHDG
jgi:cobyrinic acid a,c-diamide synthase